MKSGTVDREAVVAYARRDLTAILPQVAEIEKDLSAQENELAEFLIRLEVLHAGTPPLEADKQEDLVGYKLDRAMRMGLAPPGYKPEVSPYIAQDESLITASGSSFVAYRAQGIHSANLLSDNRIMIPQLRIFVGEVPRGTRTPPSEREPPNCPQAAIISFIPC